MSPQANSGIRDRILKSAEDHFAEYGFSKVTMDEIARDAGMGKASLYYYFRTKEELFRAVIMGAYDDFERRMKEVLVTKISAAEKLRAYAGHRISYFSKLLGLNILEVPAAIKLRPVFFEMFDEFARREIKLLRRIVQEGKDRGEFEVGPVDRVARAFLHVVRGLRLCRIREARGRRIGDEGMADLRQELDLVLGIFLRGIETGKNPPNRRGSLRIRRPHLIV